MLPVERRRVEVFTPVFASQSDHLAHLPDANGQASPVAGELKARGGGGGGSLTELCGLPSQ